MIRHTYIQRSQEKCNFCYSWFYSPSKNHDCLHICDPCRDKAISDASFRAPSSDGKYWYQVILLKDHTKMGDHPQNTLISEETEMRQRFLQKLATMRDKEIKKVSKTWEQVFNKIACMNEFNDKNMEECNRLVSKYMQQTQKKQEILVKNIQSINDQIQKEVNHQFTQIYRIQINLQKKQPLQQLKFNQNSALNHKIYNNQKKYRKNNGKNITQCWSPQKNTTNLNKNIKNITKRVKTQVFDENQEFTPIKSSIINSNKDKQSLMRSCNNINDFLSQNASFKNSNNRLMNLIQKCGFEKNSKKMRLQRSPNTVKSFNGHKDEQKLNWGQKRARDLEIIAKDAMKSKIYNYLQTFSSVPPALYLVMTFKIYDALQNTTNINGCIQLVSHNIADIDIKCYLSMLEWQSVDILKLVKVGLTDEQFSIILEFIQCKNIESIVVSNNYLTQKSCVEIGHKNPKYLKNLYLGRNKISKNKVREQIKQMQQQYTLYL